MTRQLLEWLPKYLDHHQVRPPTTCGLGYTHGVVGWGMPPPSGLNRLAACGQTNLLAVLRSCHCLVFSNGARGDRRSHQTGPTQTTGGCHPGICKKSTSTLATAEPADWNTLCEIMENGTMTSGTRSESRRHSIAGLAAPCGLDCAWPWPAGVASRGGMHGASVPMTR